MTRFAIPRKTLPPRQELPGGVDPHMPHAVIRRPDGEWLAVGRGAPASGVSVSDGGGGTTTTSFIRRVLGRWRTSMVSTSWLERLRPTGTAPLALTSVVFAGTPENPYLVTRNGHLPGSGVTDFAVQHLPTSRVWQFFGSLGCVLPHPTITGGLRVFTWSSSPGATVSQIDVADINPESDTAVPSGSITLGVGLTPAESYEIRVFPWWPDEIVVVYVDIQPPGEAPAVETDGEEEFDATQMLGPLIQLPKGSTATRTYITDGYFDGEPDQIVYYWRDIDPDPAVVAANPDVLTELPELSTTCLSKYEIKGTPESVVVERYNNNLARTNRTYVPRGYLGDITVKTEKGHKLSDGFMDIAPHDATAFRRAGFYNDSGAVVVQAGTRRYQTRSPILRIRNSVPRAIETRLENSAVGLILPGDRSSEDQYWTSLTTYRTLMSDASGQALLDRPLHRTTIVGQPLPRPIRLWRVFFLPEEYPLDSFSGWEDTGIRVLPFFSGGTPVSTSWGAWAGPPPGYEGMPEARFRINLEEKGGAATVRTRVKPGVTGPVSSNPFAADRLDFDSVEIEIPPSKYERVLAVRSAPLVDSTTLPFIQSVPITIGGRSCFTNLRWGTQAGDPTIPGDFFPLAQSHITLNAAGGVAHGALVPATGLDVRLGRVDFVPGGASPFREIRFTPNQGRTRDNSFRYEADLAGGEPQADGTVGLETSPGVLPAIASRTSEASFPGVEAHPHGFWSDAGGWQVWRNGVAHDP